MSKQEQPPAAPHEDRDGDGAPLGPSGAGLSDRNGPSDRGNGKP